MLSSAAASPAPPPAASANRGSATMLAFSKQGVKQLRPRRLPATLLLRSLDYLLVLLDFIQTVGLITTMALQSASWPITITRELGFSQAVLVDIYGFRARQYYLGNQLPIPSDEVAVPVVPYFTAFAALPVVILCLRWLSLKLTARWTPDRLLAVQATSVAVAHTIAYCTLLPMGVALARVFHCNADLSDDGGSVMEIDNAVSCGASMQQIFMGVGTIVFCLWTAGLVWSQYRYLIRGTVAHTQRRHENYLSLQEQLFDQGASSSWLLRGLFFLSSFQRRGLYYRLILLAMKAALVAVFAALRPMPQTQAALVFGLMCTQLSTTVLLRPFRSFWLTVTTILLQLCLVAMAVLLMLKRTSLVQALLESPYLEQEIWLSVGFGLAVGGSAWLWSCYKGVHAKTARISPTSNADIVGGESSKTPHARARALIVDAYATMERSWRSPPLVAPIYDVAEKIQQVNFELHLPQVQGLLASRQQEQDRQDLAHLLEELVGCHSQLKPRSIFGLTRKASAWRTGAELYAMLPEFVEHLQRRDQQMLILPPLLRRTQLKCFAMRVFEKMLEERRQTAAGSRRSTLPRASASTASNHDRSNVVLSMEP